MEAPTCANLPHSLSAFIDAFVDFSVSGLFLPSSATATASPSLPPARLPPASRLVAIGDLHGDFQKSIQSLSLAGLIDPASLRWVGGSSVAVQVGDVLDRGGDELRILYLIRRLQTEAEMSGGRLLMLNGNHETMNVARSFRYVTPAGLEEFRNWATWYRTGLAMKRLCLDLPPQRDPFKGVPKSFPGIKPEYWEGFHARIAALRPTGPITTRFLSSNHTILVVGNSVFVHGGLLQKHVEYGLDRINQDVRNWMATNEPKQPMFVFERDAVVWLRAFSDGFNCDCTKLEEVLGLIPGARRLIMGHTIQTEGINAVCGDQAVRVDVGLSKGCGDGVPEVLEITEGGRDARILTASWNRVYEGKKRAWEREKDVGGLAWLVRDSVVKEVETKA
ncbi:shewanella-like protein phosphatase 2 [Carex rostrata]